LEAHAGGHQGVAGTLPLPHRAPHPPRLRCPAFDPVAELAWQGRDPQPLSRAPREGSRLAVARGAAKLGRALPERKANERISLERRDGRERIRSTGLSSVEQADLPDDPRSRLLSGVPT
jgi:hypothetical protein